MQQKKQKKKKADYFTNILLVIGLFLIIFSGYQLYQIYSDYNESNVEYESMSNQFIKQEVPVPETPDKPAAPTSAGSTKHDDGQDSGTETSGGQEPEPEPEPSNPNWHTNINVDMKGLKNLNPDIVGWIYFENGSISYPVLYSGNNSTYLRTTPEGKTTTAGSIFIEGKNNPDLQDSHTIIYGHNMKNLSMFGKLKYYLQEGYYNQNKYFQIHTMDKIYRYKIFAYSDIPDDSFVYAVPYGDNQEFKDFLAKLYKTSFKDTGVQATSSDKVITLSTCSTEARRFVVHAVRVDEHDR